MADVLTVIAPVFILLMLGYGLGRTRIFPEGTSAALIAFVWYVAIPAMLFRSLASKHLPGAEEWVFVGGYYGSIFFVYFIAMMIARFVFRLTLAEQGVFAFSSCFANGGFIGLPIVGGAYGDEGVHMLLVILSFHSLSLITTSTIIVERAKNSADGPGMWVRTFQSVRQNPIILGLLAGLLWSGLELPFPLWFDRIFALPAEAAAPTGLFALGLSLTRVKLAGDLVQSATAAALKLFLIPATVFVVTRHMLGLSDTWVGIATLTAALPTGMMPYTFGTQYQVGARRAASTVILSTATSAITLSLVLLLLASVLH